jgi:hypothetical protein
MRYHVPSGKFAAVSLVRSAWPFSLAVVHVVLGEF